jgi:threonyl-tRNA synthetase
LVEKGIRVERDFRNEKLGFKIREAQLQKIPYMLVIGDKEEKEGTVSPRKRSGESMKPMGVGEFIAQVESEVPTIGRVKVEGGK